MTVTDFGLIVTLTADEVAERYVAEAVIETESVQVPAATIVTLVPETVQTPVVDDEYVFSPSPSEVGVVVDVRVKFASPYVLDPGSDKEIVLEVSDEIVNERSTTGAAL